YFFFSSRRRHTRFSRDWSSDVCSSDLLAHKLNYVNNGGRDINAGYDGNAFTVIISGFGVDNNYIYSPQGAVLDFSQPCPYNCLRSEERRVGKECRSRCSTEREVEKINQ